MTIYVALLRGINVGGKNMIKMADLKRAFEAIGLSRVQTYIQSGNVLFESDEDEEMLRKRIEHRIEVVFGFAVMVVLRTSVELERIIENCPFSEEAVSEAEASSKAESLYVSFLIQPPSLEGVERMNPYKCEEDQFISKGREVYLLVHNSIRNSKVANNLHKLNAPATTRNWKTINKLAGLTKAREVYGIK